MQEVYTSRAALADIARRVSVIQEQIDLERRQGLEADWTAIAEAFEMIAEAATGAAKAAWTVQYEGAE